VSASERKVYPANSETTIEVDSKEKKRGVFRVPVYIAILKTKVTFNKPASQKIEASKGKKLSELDYLIIPVEPIASVQSFKIKELASGKELKARLVDGGIRLSVEELPNKDFFANQLEIEVSMRGTGTITYES